MPYTLVTEVHFVPANKGEQPIKSSFGVNYYLDKKSKKHDLPKGLTYKQAEDLAEFTMDAGYISSYVIEYKKSQ
jgi:hypothetical protein